MAIGGVILGLILQFFGQVLFAPVHSSSPRCLESRDWSDITSIGFLLAVGCVILASFRVFWPGLLLVVAAVAFGFAALTAIRVGYSITLIFGVMLAVATAGIAALQWHTP